MSLADELAALIRPIVHAAVRDALAEVGAPAGTAAEYLSPEQAGVICSVEAATIRSWVKSGALRGYRAGRLLRVSRTELQRYLARPGAAQDTDEAAEVEELARAAADRQRRRLR